MGQCSITYAWQPNLPKDKHLHVPTSRTAKKQNKKTIQTHVHAMCTLVHLRGPSSCRMMKDLHLSPQGMLLTLGGVHKFRFNHPDEAAVLRERRRVGDNHAKD